MGVWIEKSVLEPMNFDQIKNKSINKEVKCCCCFSKGNFKIDASFEKDKYINGEDVIVLANIENNTTANGKMIFDANLYVTLTDGINKQSVTLPCGKMQEQPHIQPSQKVASQFKFNLQSNDKWPTCVGGALVTGIYILSLKADPDVCCLCCDEPPTCQIPIFVGGRMSNQMPVFQPPVSNWSPQVLPAVNFNVPVVQFVPQAAPVTPIVMQQPMMGGPQQQMMGGPQQPMMMQGNMMPQANGMVAGPGPVQLMPAPQQYAMAKF